MRHTIILSIGAALFAVTASAETRVWKTTGRVNDWDWTEDGNFEGGVAPVAGDTVEVGNITVKLSDSDMDSFNLASSLERIRPMHADARIEFTINGTGAPLSFGASIRYHNNSYSDINRRGRIVKKGAGLLELTSRANAYAYATDMEVIEGTLSAKSSAATSGNSWYGNVAVSNGASFFTRTAGRTWIQRLYGDGTVTNSGATQINVSGGTSANPVELTPWMSKLGYYSCGRVMIRRTDNTFGSFAVYSGTPNPTDGSGTTGFYAIGKKGQRSSIGTAETIGTAENGGTLLYLGDGNETETDKNFSQSYATWGPATFDAGAYGGLTFTGEWRYGGSAGKQQGMARLIFAGSNTHECVIAGSIKNATYTNNLGEKGFSFHITKKGTGTWRFTDPTSSQVRENYTGIAVEEGTLKYDSIQEAGDKCALGMATNLYESYLGAYNEAYRVPYAYRIGSGLRSYPDDGLATFEYSGTTGAMCRTRPIALGGDARLVNSSGHPFRFSGISAISNGVQMLVLGGDVSADNAIQDLTDGAGGCRLGVIKEGDSTWTITQTNTFSGPVVVKGGVLKVRRVMANTPYTWFKLVVKDLWSRFEPVTGYVDELKIGRIALCDSEGYRHNIGFTRCDAKPVGLALQPGQIGWGMKKLYNWWIGREADSPTSGLAEVTAAGETYDGSCLFMSRDLPIDPDDPKKWLEIEMRLTNGTPEIAYYDLAVVYGITQTTSYLTNYNLRAWSLLGSTDGWNWEELHSVTNSKSADPDQKLKLPNKNRYWMGMNTYTKDYPATAVHDTAKMQPIRGHVLDSFPDPLTNVEWVAVSDGGVLEADGEITLSNFRAAANGVAGTVRGFTLAQDCTLDVTDLPERPESFDIPINFDGMSPGDARWTLKVGGSETTKYKLVTVGNKLRFIVKAMTFTIR